MQITRDMLVTGQRISRQEERMDARHGCFECPGCSATVSDKDVIEVGYRLEIFKKRLMRVDCFECLRCGDEWESDPYTHIIKEGYSNGKKEKRSKSHMG